MIGRGLTKKRIQNVSYRKKTDSVPTGVKYEVKGNTVSVNGPKGQVQTHVPAGVKLEQQGRHHPCDPWR